MQNRKKINFKVGIGLRKIHSREKRSQQLNNRISQSLSNPMIKRGFMPFAAIQKYKSFSIENPKPTVSRLSPSEITRIQSLSNSQDINNFQVLLPKLKPGKHLKFMYAYVRLHRYTLNHDRRCKYTQSQFITETENEKIKPKKPKPQPLPLNQLNFQALMKKLKDKRQVEDKEHQQSGHNSVYYERIKNYYESKYIEQESSEFQKLANYQV